jgi:hypothetical protein
MVSCLLAGSLGSPPPPKSLKRYMHCDRWHCRTHNPLHCSSVDTKLCMLYQAYKISKGKQDGGGRILTKKSRTDFFWWSCSIRRLAPDRRVYALFAKGLPKEPLVFVHVALVSELSNSIQTILEPYNRSTNHNIHDSRYAICYSITTQQGLGGIHLGNYLIRRVVDQLQQTYSQIHTFATLSPIPGFRQWLNEQLSKDPSLWKQLVQAGGTTHWEQVSGRCKTWRTLGINRTFRRSKMSRRIVP